VDRTARVVTESTENRKLFHMPSMEDLRASFARRNMSGERNDEEIERLAQQAAPQVERILLGKG